ncbi:MAG: hypothetical protein EOP12_05650 [Pseudomonas sp.]|nr:MAG: hypothetical protein EOP12_05650 [Pseudomonas sp.]
MIELLRDEGVQIESVFLEETESGASLIYYLRSADPVRAREVSRSSTDPIDLYHQKVMKEISAGWTRLECLLDVGTADEPQKTP